jgi:hypothetical protein
LRGPRRRLPLWLLLVVLAALSTLTPARARPESRVTTCPEEFSETGFLILDCGADEAGNHDLLCSEYHRFGGRTTLGAPISAPFRVGPWPGALYQMSATARSAGDPIWRAQNLSMGLELLHHTGYDPTLNRSGIPFREQPGSHAIDERLRPAYFGLPRGDLASRLRLSE